MQQPAQQQPAQQHIQSAVASPPAFTQAPTDRFAIQQVKHDGLAIINPVQNPNVTDRPASIEDTQIVPHASPMDERGQQNIPTILAQASVENRLVTNAAVADPTGATTSTTIPAPVLPRVTLAIAGVRPGQGPVRVAIFTDATSFPNPASACETFTLGDDKSTVESQVAVVESFAVGVYQDINSDGELNRNRYGIPLEPFAFSNNALGQRGPPKFADAAITLSTQNSISPTLVPIQLP